MLISFTILCSFSVPSPDRKPENPCIPSPCGPNSQCRVVGTQPACSCLQNYIGRPPNCRPECINNAECPNYQSCKNEKCVDPCPGICGTNSQCTVVNHNPVCSCFSGYTGDPFSSCILLLPQCKIVYNFYFKQKANNPSCVFQLLNALHHLHHVSHLHVDQTLNVVKKMVLGHVYVHQVSMETHMTVKKVVIENVKLIPIVRLH